MILDGWGIGRVPAADAIAQAKTPVMDRLWQQYPHSTLITYGEDVGLPEGQMGNSEVGHMNIGAGRVVYQELARINKEIKEHKIEKNPAILEMIAYCKEHDKPLHLIGLISDGGVHSHISHSNAILKMLSAKGVRGYIHAFTDGRDTGPTSGYGFMEQLIQSTAGTSFTLASIIGRYYAMDRDHRWDRVKRAYDLLVHGKGTSSDDPLGFVKSQYENEITDEFLTGWLSADIAEESRIKEGDAVFFVNFRTDRPRQLTEALVRSAIEDYGMTPLHLDFTTMTSYDEHYANIRVVYRKEALTNTLGDEISRHGLTQLRVAETEKYPHVTFFFSGGREAMLPGERRILMPSPKVRTYDLQPEMSAADVKQCVLDAVKGDQQDFICVNFANTDMVGHTGVFEAAMRAAETIDNCVGEICSAALAADYRVLILADHGNSDFMINADGTPNTAHTMNPVPCILVGGDVAGLRLHDGRLCDVAPTVLKLLGQNQPPEMTGTSLINQDK